MSKLYGTVTNESSKTSTRCARSIVTAAAQSYAGSVAVTIRFVDGVEFLEIAAGPGSDSDPSHVLLACPLSYLVSGVRVSPTRLNPVATLSVNFGPTIDSNER